MLPGVSDSDASKIIQGRPYADKSQLISKKGGLRIDLREDQGSRDRQAIQVVIDATRRHGSVRPWQCHGLTVNRGTTATARAAPTAP